MYKSLFGAVFTIGLLVGTATSASAALVPTSPSCGNTGAWAAITPGYAACLGSFDGTDTTQQADVLPAMTSGFVGSTGLGTWTLDESIPGNGSGTLIASSAGSAGGPINFASPLTGFFSLALTSGNQFSLYLFDATSASIASINYTTAGAFIDGNGRRQDLTELSLYSFQAGGPDPEAIPLPATGVLLGGGMVLAGLIARRRAKK